MKCGGKNPVSADGAFESRREQNFSFLRLRLVAIETESEREQSQKSLKAESARASEHQR